MKGNDNSGKILKIIKEALTLDESAMLLKRRIFKRK